MSEGRLVMTRLPLNAAEDMELTSLETRSSYYVAVQYKDRRFPIGRRKLGKSLRRRSRRLAAFLAEQALDRLGFFQQFLDRAIEHALREGVDLQARDALEAALLADHRHAAHQPFGNAVGTI